MTVNPEYQLLINNVAYDFISLKFDHEPRDLEKVPKFNLKLPNKFNLYDPQNDFNAGSVVQIIREGELVFKGIIEPKVFKIEPTDSLIELNGSNVWYKKLANTICDSYDFIESTTDYGVTINPWEFKPLVHTHPTVTLESIGRERPVLDGFTVEKVVEHITGTKFLYSHDFQDLTHLLPSTTRTDTSNLLVYRDTKVSGTYYQTTPRLQLMHNGNSGGNTLYKSSGTVESVSLYNGDPNIEPMGNITSVTLTAYGKAPAGSSILFYVCRDGQNSTDPISGNTFNKANRNYVLFPSFTATNIAIPGTSDTITKVVGTIGPSDWGAAPPGNQLAYKITVTAGTGNLSTPEIEYMMFECTTSSDTGISAGFMQPYVGDSSIGGSSFFTGNLESGTRLKALGALRESTIKIYTGSNEDDLISTFWDIWIDTDGVINFKKNRGATINRTYSFENSSFSGIEYEFDGTDIWYKVVAYGAGSGIYRTRIVSSEEFDDGGLTIASVRTMYGDAAKVGSFEDSGQSSVNQLYRKARGALKLHSKPFESLKIPGGLITEQERLYTVGDLIYITITNLGMTNKLFPIEELSRTFDANGEKINVVLGSPLASISKAISNITGGQKDIKVVRQASGGKAGVTGSGTYFDSSHYGVFTFGVSEPEKIKKISLKAITVPFDGNIRASKAGSAHSHTITGTAVDGGGGGIFDATFSNKNVTGTANGQTIGSATAAGQTIASATAAAQGTTVNNSSFLGGDTSHSFNIVANTPQTSSDSWSGSNPANFDGYLYGLTATGGDGVDWNFQMSIGTNIGTIIIWQDMVCTFNDGQDIYFTMFLPASHLKGVGITSLSSATIAINQVTGGTHNTVISWNMYSVPRHSNATSGVTGSNNTSSVTGSTNSSSLSSTTLTAANWYAFLSNLRLGYDAPPGGTGTGTSFVANSVTYYDKHNHAVTGIATGSESAHTHGVQFGIFTFSGDSDSSGNGPAVMASNVNIWVDPSNETTPESGAQVPVSFGNLSASTEIDEIDITSRLKTDSNGLIKRGIHKIFVKSSAGDTNNSLGLGKIQFVVLDTFKEDSV